MQRPTYAKINLARIAHNIQSMKARLGKTTRLMAVVKANAYGHGAVAVSQKAVESGADYLGVSIPEEGVELRNAGITAPILILGGIRPQSVPMVLQYGLAQTVFSLEILHALEKEAKELGTTAVVHIKLDTGMNRIGLKGEAELKTMLEHVKQCPHVVLEGVFTHFAVSEIEDKSFTSAQILEFEKALELVRKMGFSPMVHCSNSGAIMDLPQYDFDMVRTGISLYGYYPSENPDHCIDLLPVMEFLTTVVHVKTIHRGDTVSYGRLFEAPGDMRVATLPVGYGDGYKLSMTGKAQAIIHGRRVPVIGRICMDQCVIDVTHIEDVYPGDEVTLIGEQGTEAIYADELARWANTISYEILLSVSARVPRKYI